VCTWDHPLFTDKDDAVMMEEQNNLKEGSDKGQLQKEQRDLMDAIKVAVQQVSSTNMLPQGMRVALLPTMAKMNLYGGEGSQDTNTKNDGPLAFFIPNNNANKMNVPSTLQSAISDNGKYPVATLRYGSLFGTPSSSVCGNLCIDLFLYMVFLSFTISLPLSFNFTLNDMIARCISLYWRTS
jgi:hypothetical protein